MELIKFKGNEYPSLIINFPFGERKISTTKLNDSLMNYAGGYVSEEARFIDEQIFYFVEEEDIHHLQKKELVEMILSEI